MVEFLAEVKTLPWASIGLIGLFIINSVIISILFYTFKKIKTDKQENNKVTIEIFNDIKALFESGSTLGTKIKNLEFAVKIMKEEQEQLSLKEPSQQTYRNAVQLIKRGESVNTISESSGLALGEIELLKLFQRIDKASTKTKDSIK